MNRRARHRHPAPFAGLLILIFALAGCNLPRLPEAAPDGGPVTPPPAATLTPATPARTPGPIPLPYTILTPSPTGLALTPPSPTPDPFTGQPYQDAGALFSGVCFDYWVAQVNRVYVIDSAFAHIDFYNEVDDSALCRFPVERRPFDFETGEILVGAVNVGTGCWAYTAPLALEQDDAARTVTLWAAWGIAGDCDYRLARPFFVRMPRPPEGYTVGMTFEEVTAVE